MSYIEWLNNLNNISLLGIIMIFGQIFIRKFEDAETFIGAYSLKIFIWLIGFILLLVGRYVNV